MLAAMNSPQQTGCPPDTGMAATDPFLVLGKARDVHLWLCFRDLAVGANVNPKGHYKAQSQPPLAPLPPPLLETEVFV